MDLWEQMLDEYALAPDAMTWFHVRGLRIPIADQFAAVQECVSRGYLAWAGMSRLQWVDTLYGITPLGRAHWEQHIRGRRLRPKKADPVPRWSIAKLAAAQGPVSVWDLVRIPVYWDRRAEQMREWGECE